MISIAALVIILQLLILTNTILLLLDLVVFHGLFREELLLSFPSKTLSALDKLSVLRYGCFAVILFEVCIEGS